MRLLLVEDEKRMAQALSQPLQDMMPPDRPRPEEERGFKPGFDPESPKFQLSTFYSAAVSYDGEILATRNEPPTVHTDASLEQSAMRIIQGGKETGTENNLAFYKADKGGYILVVFMDNTVVNENAMTLLCYTRIFGCVALVLFFFLSAFLAKRIVDPLEESYRKQKQFISDAGHELKTPVSVVSANADLLSREIGDNQWLSNIQYENQRMGMLVCQLLELAHTETVTPQMEHIDLPFPDLLQGFAAPRGYRRGADHRRIPQACPL